MATSIAILGGAGAEGSGLAKRYAAAGHPVIIGSRQAERAASTAAALNAEMGSNLISGADNAGAAQAGDIVLLTIPYEGMEQTLPPLAEALAGKIVVS
ncbi:MAG: NAD(P)-binding domain-containing protein, partial [Chloroflexi bacterium]|nr:NAD(P)-binding domain-containing protein [Chloroflexota bacterium]